MKIRFAWVLASAALLAGGCAATEPHPAGPDMSGRPYVEAMGKYLASVQQFSVRIRTEKDQVIDGGAVIGPTERVLRLRRPDRLSIQLVHPEGNRQVWYDGSRVVCLEVKRKAYASVPVQGSIDRMFTTLRGGGHYVRPLAALCESNPCASLCSGARRVGYLGRKTLGNRACNVVRIERVDASVDLWILDGAQPLPLKAVVRQTDHSQPERIAHFDGWNVQARLSDAEFKPKLPAGAYEIEMADVTGLP